MPILTRIHSCVFKQSIIDRKPLCPPCVPFGLIRKVPNGSARSSEMTINLSTDLSSFASRQLTVSPLRFSTFLDDLRFEYDFLDDNDRRNNRFRRIMDLNAFTDMQIRYVNAVFGRQVRDINVDRLRSFRRLAKDLYLTHCLRKNRTLF